MGNYVNRLNFVDLSLEDGRPVADTSPCGGPRDEPSSAPMPSSRPAPLTPSVPSSTPAPRAPAPTRGCAAAARIMRLLLSEHTCRCDKTLGGTEHPPAIPAARELLRLLEDAGLYPALCRDRPPPPHGARDAPVPEVTGRIRTGDTILNIRGALRDAIGDARAAPSPAPRASRVDALVIRPSQRQLAAPPLTSRRNDHRNTENRERYGQRSIVAAGARIRLLCDLRNVTDVVWYKDGERMVPREGENVGASAEGGPRVDAADGALLVERATRTDAGVWRCAGSDPSGVRITGPPITLMLHEAVRGVWLAVDGRRLDAGNTWVPVHENKPLEVLCVAEGGQPPPELVWRVWPEPAPDRRFALRHHPTNQSADGVRSSRVAVTAARELHNATLECEALQPTPASQLDDEDTVEAPTPPPAVVASAKLQMHVTYPPSFVISRWPGFGVVLRVGAAAALRCDVDANPPVSAWWQRDGDDPPSSPTPSAGPAGGFEDDTGAGRSATLRWAVLSAAHAGWYRCRAAWNHTHFSSIGYYLNVIYEDLETTTEDSSEHGESAMAEEERGAPGVGADDDVPRQTVEVPLGGSVQLHCPKGSVGCWSRRVVGGAAGADEWTPAGSRHAHGVLALEMHCNVALLVINKPVCNRLLKYNQFVLKPSKDGHFILRAPKLLDRT
ncbi:Roundabout homolog 3 [Eumeta japonica]|uniref:Roundabout homolog 3 n=1 Tax=Eumeta variegata TaxID=151549 RepID=A0A4C1ZGD8_EUMVA|nr:Roundabout homolog 3 [Eumeta japonica]